MRESHKERPEFDEGELSILKRTPPQIVNERVQMSERGNINEPIIKIKLPASRPPWNQTSWTPKNF